VETHLEDTNTIGQQPGSNENDQGTITEFNPDYIISDPGLRIPIEQFSPNIRDEIRRAFMERGPTQPSSHVFPRGEDKRRFRKEWFEKSLAMKMVELKRHEIFPLVYRLIELALLLPVATASVERAFSAMKIIKTELRNKMSDGWLNDLMVVYIEREIFKGIDLESIKKAFQKKKDRNMQLPKSPRRN